VICHERQFIFVHIPKTAGSSLNEALGVPWQNHKDLSRYQREVTPEIFRNYFKFTVVRNPWARLFSDYNFQRTKSGHKCSRLYLYDENGKKRSFAQWVEKVFASPRDCEARQWGGTVSPSIHRWSPQVDWISVDGEVQVDYVARIENLDEDFPAICQRIDAPAPRLPTCKKKFHWHYSHYYDTATRDRVAEYYAKDIAEFGYEFEAAPAPTFWQRMLFACTSPGARAALTLKVHALLALMAEQSIDVVLGG